MKLKNLHLKQIFSTFGWTTLADHVVLYLCLWGWFLTPLVFRQHLWLTFCGWSGNCHTSFRWWSWCLKFWFCMWACKCLGNFWRWRSDIRNRNGSLTTVLTCCLLEFICAWHERNKILFEATCKHQYNLSCQNWDSFVHDCFTRMHKEQNKASKRKKQVHILLRQILKQTP